MNQVKIPKPFNKYDNEWFYNFLDTYPSMFLIKKNILYNLIQDIDDDNLKIVLYVIYQIMITNDLSVSNIRQKPFNGVQLTNPITTKPLGIYHIHLENGFVLIWYMQWNENGFNLVLKYMEHPSSLDNYRTIVKEIYDDNSGFNVDLGDYFSNLKSIILERLLNFNDFIHLFYS